MTTLSLMFQSFKSEINKMIISTREMLTLQSKPQISITQFPPEIIKEIWDFLDPMSKVAVVDAHGIFRKCDPKMNIPKEKYLAKIARDFISQRNANGAIIKFIALGDFRYISLFMGMDFRDQEIVNFWYEDTYKDIIEGKSSMEDFRKRMGMRILTQAEKNMRTSFHFVLWKILQSDNVEIFRCFIDGHEIRCHTWGEACAEIGSVNILQFLIECAKDSVRGNKTYTFDMEMSSFMNRAIQNGQIRAVKLLIEMGTNNLYTHHKIAIYCNQINIATLIGSHLSSEYAKQCEHLIPRLEL
jgi:hypothetical protein